MSKAEVTTDHAAIRKWAEKRGGRPATVEGTQTESKGKTKSKGRTAGILRLDFKPKDDKLEEIDWQAFFDKFEEAKLAFLYQERTATGRISRFHKFVDRETAANDAHE